MKKYRKFVGTAGLILAAMVLLTGCATHKAAAYTPPNGGFYGWIFTWIGKPLQNIMLQCYRLIGGSNGAGWAIILMTLVVRTILLPLMLNQQKKSTTQQEKMTRVQPQMLLIQKAMKRKDITQDQQMTLATWQRELYSQNNLSLTGGMGCLPLLIQMPIMIGIYQAVMYSRVLANSKFFGISLSERSILVAIIATVFALAQSYLSMVGIPKEQKKQMQSMLLMNPLMTLFISLTVSGSVALYWAAGNFFSLLQQLIVTYIIMPKVKRNVAKELEKQPIKEIVTQAKIDELFNDKEANPAVKKQKQELHQKLRNRNQGKQHKRP